MGKIKSIIGFEVDTSEIRAVEISRSGSILTVQACGEIPLQEGIVEDGFIRDADAFNIALTELVQNGGFKSTDIVVGVNNENVIMRYATFPKVPDDKLRNMVLLQAQEFIPIPVQEMEIDYVVAGDGINDDEQPVTNVMLVAARRSMLEQYINYLSQAKFQIADVDTSILSLCRGIKEIVQKDEKFAILNLTDDILNFVVVKDNEISMVRSIMVPDRVQDSIKKVFNCSSEEVIDDEDIEAIGNMLATETASSVSYYSMQYMESPIQKIFLTTTTGKNNEIAEEIRKIVTEIPVVVPDYYTKHNFGLDQNVINKFAGCIGLAIQALEV